MKRVNDLLTGFRTILIAWFGVGLVAATDYLLLFISNFFTSLSGFGAGAVKGAAMAAMLVTLKQIVTDVIPKLRGEPRK